MRPNHKDSIIITGSTGWIGSNLLFEAKKLNLNVSSLTAPSNGNYRKIDITQSDAPEQLNRAYRDLAIKPNILIHAAGLAHIPIENEANTKLMWLTNLKGTQNILRFCQIAKISRLVYISTIAGYDWDSVPKFESDPIKPITSYSKSKLSAEKEVLESTLDTRVVRLATVFGKGDFANFRRLALALDSKRFIIPGKGSAHKSVIPVDLAAELIISFANLENPKHRLINLALPDAPSLRHICDSFSEECGFPKAKSVPTILLKTIAKAGDVTNRIRPFPLTSQVVAKLTTSTWVDTTRMQEVFPDRKFPNFETCLRQCSDYYASAATKAR